MRLAESSKCVEMRRRNSPEPANLLSWCPTLILVLSSRGKCEQPITCVAQAAWWPLGPFLRFCRVRMSGTQDSLTVALTGGLPFIALVSAALALPLSLLLLWLYRRAVLRSMRHRSGAAAPSVPSVQASAPPLGSIELSCDEASASPSLAPHAESLFQRAVGGSWRAAVVHCIAGAGYAVVMTLGWLISDQLRDPPREVPLVILDLCLAGGAHRESGSGFDAPEENLCGAGLLCGAGHPGGN